MKQITFLFFLSLFIACSTSTESDQSNPFFTNINAPIDYANVSSSDLEEYAKTTVSNAGSKIDAIKELSDVNFDNVFSAMDDITNEMTKASNNCFMLYWVSPDSLSRIKGFEGYQLVDSLFTQLFSDKEVFEKMTLFRDSDDYAKLSGHRKILVDDMIIGFKQSGVNLDEENLEKYKKLNKEISELTSQYSNNMNSSNEFLTLDEKGAAGLPENFKDTYKTEESRYEIPIINATRGPVTGNAESEETRKSYYFKFYNRAADKNLEILNQLRQKRHDLAQVMGYESYAAYNLSPKMAKNQETVWGFINDLVDRAKDKAKSDIEFLKQTKRNNPGDDLSTDLQPWDISYYNNLILKSKYDVDHEKIREYLPMEKCLEGVFDIYQELLGLRFKKVENPSVWHEEVEMYEVFEGNKLKGRFYLDLFPRPNKESWFYAVGLTPGKLKKEGYEIPVSMLLGNFTRPTDKLPSLLSHRELTTLFHEFGHIIDGMSYEGEFAGQSYAKSDFVEAMSQIFENWTWDYETLSSFARNYETGEVFPKEIFDNMIKAKNLSSGLGTINSLRRCIYDMNLYDKHDPENPVDTDQLWRDIDNELGIMPMHVEGTHVQASWIHINTHPVYMYGYLWSEVYAQDMFTKFEENGLRDQETGTKYRKLILANGSQRDVMEAVEEFLGRPSNNEAYIRSLGLE